MAASTELDKYDVLERIGSGSFGIIRKVRRRTDGKIMCRKEINYIKMSQKEREQLHAEISILSSLRHQNIVAYYHRDHIKLSQDLHLYMEYCGGGDLSKYIKGLQARNERAPEEFVWSIFSQLTTALYRCHSGEDPPEVGSNVLGPIPSTREGLRPKNKVMILHRDLKPENVFLGEDNSVKLGDFGLSKLMQSHDFASTYVGTPFYMSPEICAAERYTHLSDIWSLGCIIYELCQRRPPFDAKTHFHLVQKIKEGNYDPLDSMYSQELQNVVRGCLKTNSRLRPDTKQLVHLPMVRLMRKQREIVEIGRTLKTKEEETNQKVVEAEKLLASLDKDKDRARVEIRAEIEDVVRREWEVKARLEIDRQVELEKQRLQQIFDSEFGQRVEAEVASRVVSLQHTASNTQQQAALVSRPHSPRSMVAPELSSISTASSTEPPPTDLTSLSFSSPVASLNPLPRKKAARTPFSRARTQVDSPMDVQMVSPSPMSIASLSLSPRRAAALARGLPCQNLFANNLTAAERRARWQPQQMSPLTSDDDNYESDLDEVPELPSPTRPSFGKPTTAATAATTELQDPFKAPAMGTTTSATARPPMLRQRTLPANKILAQPALFTRGDVHGPGGTKPTVSPTSPTRRGSDAARKMARQQPPPPQKKSGTGAAACGGGEDMLRAVTSKNMLGGRTLVELNQARAGVASASGGDVVGAEQMKKAAATCPPAVWNPEVEVEMPSPFLRRGTKGLSR